MTLATYSIGAAATLALALPTWVVSVIKRNVSIVDTIWSLMLLAATLAYTRDAESLTPRSVLILTLVTIWALRLALYVAWRNWGEAEDRRYREIRRRYEPGFALKSLGIVFVLQALLAWIISMPLWAALSMPATSPYLDVLAVVLWSFGIVFETVADWQLARFKGDPAHHGQVMNRGLWRYSRHPNYFGECVLWWGFYLFACSVGAWWTAIGPLVLTFLLLRVSGVALLERTIVERRPAYRDYIACTNAFVPGPRKRTGARVQALATVLLVCTLASAHGASAEPTTKIYEFTVRLDDREIGWQRFEVSTDGDRTRVRIEANFEVKFWVFTAYSYRHTNEEVWEGDCLREIRSKTDDNGRDHFVRGRYSDGQLTLETRDGQKTVDGCVKTYAYWNPDWLREGPLLNSQTGKLDPVTVTSTGKETISVGGRSMPSDVRRIRSEKFTIDLWHTRDGEWLALRSTTRDGGRLFYELNTPARAAVSTSLDVSARPSACRWPPRSLRTW